MDYSLSDTEVLNLAGDNTRMFTYQEIAKMSRLDQLINNQYPKAVILYMTGPNYGHWCGIKLMNVNGQVGIYFFDPYGTFPDSELGQIQKMKGREFAEETDQIHKKLTELIKKSPIQNVYYSQYRLQKLSPRISTCGRWTGLFLRSNMDEKQFNQHIHKIKLQLQKGTKKLITNDDVIVYLTENLF